MDKIRLDFFDVLGYLMPGTALLLSLWITADRSVVSLDDLYLFISKISANTLLSGIIVAYVIGFTLHFLGSFLFSNVYLRLTQWKSWKPATKSDERAQYVSHYWALLRQHGDKHLPVLDRWQALKALSSNLAAFSFVAIGLSLWKWHCTHQEEWLYLSPVFVLLYFSYSNRAKTFKDYLEGDADAVLKSLNLYHLLPPKP